MNDPAIAKLASAIVEPAYIEQGCAEIRRREGLIKKLLANRCIPEDPWSDDSIRYFLSQLSLMDSNNFSEAVGAGEREGRVFSSIVRERHFGLGHGIGRSGDVAAVQPKAAGSSLLYKLTNRLALHAVRLCGVLKAEAALVLPTATGLTLSLVFLTILDLRRKEWRKALDTDAAASKTTSNSTPELSREGPRYIIWSRIDQKSCYKSLLTAGLTPIVVDPILVGDELTTNIEGITKAIESCSEGPSSIVAIVTTTSCFAPRAPDDVVSVAKLCKEKGIPHVVNNAYGLQIGSVTHALNEACRVGRVDAFVSSCDKNFMVPVGGAIVASPDESIITAVSRVYPGRASVSPIVDLFVTFLSMGVSGLKGLLKQRKEVATYLKAELTKLAGKHAERVLESKSNHISFAMTIGGLASSASAATYLGSMLFSRGVSGTRVVHPAATSTIDGRKFTGYGSQVEGGYRHGPYITAAAAIGMTTADVDVFISRLDRAIAEFLKQQKAKEVKSDGKETKAKEATEALLESAAGPVLPASNGAGTEAPATK
jgi:O-phospho-L-seryl-tRNASec:L-selenocysteinyl-tRNA synthase